MNFGRAALVDVVHPDWVLGIDGGGTRTDAVLAERTSGHILGRGVGGPSNVMAVGVAAGTAELNRAVAAAFDSAGRPRGAVAAAALGLAGVDRESGRATIFDWATTTHLAEQITIANDATLLLAAGTPAGWGLAVIAGTGSIAFIQTPAGTVGRAGGWGGLLGDEGSAYRLALEALRAVCRTADFAGPPTALTAALLKSMNLGGEPDLIPAVYHGPWNRTRIASLAPVVLAAAADHDEVALQIVQSEARELAHTAASAVRHHDLAAAPVPTALAGGLLLGSELYRTTFLHELTTAGITPHPVTPVPEPVLGAVVLARNLLTRNWG